MLADSSNKTNERRTDEGKAAKRGNTERWRTDQKSAPDIPLTGINEPFSKYLFIFVTGSLLVCFERALFDFYWLAFHSGR